MNCNIQSWKDKAISRRIEIWLLRKRIKELIKSRNNWKKKYKCQKNEYTKLVKELKELKKEHSTQVKHHTYSSEFISLCLNLRTIGGSSLRGCIKIINVLSFLLELELRQPSPTSIRNWEIKMGYQKVHKKCEDTKADWMVILDESVSVGSQKILLILGINLSKYDFTSALKMSDVEVLSIKIKKSWKSEEINEVFMDLKQRQYSFKYACSDNGNNLRKVLKMNNLVHIEDCGHCLGKVLEKKYKNNIDYTNFSKEKSLFQKQNLLSKYAVFLPPKQRTKGRYMNLGSTVKWALKVLKVAKEYEQMKVKAEAFEKIKWLLKYENLIIELYKEQRLIDYTNKKLKRNGLSKETIKEIKEQIEKKEVGEDFSNQIIEYLNRNSEKLPKEKRLLCSSDIIESIFGKFKNSLSDNSMAGLTEGSLVIANYGKKISPIMAKKEMEGVKMIDIQNWREENLPLSIHQQRKRLFKITG